MVWPLSATCCGQFDLLIWSPYVWLNQPVAVATYSTDVAANSANQPDQTNHIKTDRHTRTHKKFMIDIQRFISFIKILCKSINFFIVFFFSLECVFVCVCLCLSFIQPTVQYKSNSFLLLKIKNKLNIHGS